MNCNASVVHAGNATCPPKNTPQGWALPQRPLTAAAPWQDILYPAPAPLPPPFRGNDNGRKQTQTCIYFGGKDSTKELWVRRSAWGPHEHSKGLVKSFFTTLFSRALPLLSLQTPSSTHIFFKPHTKRNRKAAFYWKAVRWKRALLYHSSTFLTMKHFWPQYWIAAHHCVP